MPCATSSPGLRLPAGRDFSGWWSLHLAPKWLFRVGPIAHPWLLALLQEPLLLGPEQDPGDTALLTHSFSCALNLFTPRPCLCFVRALLCSALLCSSSFNICESTLEHLSKVLACHSFHLPDPRFIRSALEIPPSTQHATFLCVLFPSFLG
jgi:hypothetical protein